MTPTHSPKKRYLFQIKNLGITLITFLAFSFLTRLIIFALNQSTIKADLHLIYSFLFGFVSDLFTGLFLAIPCGLFVVFCPKINKYTYGIYLFILSSFILFTSISELVFWDEFGVRFNFIAVDYLVFTTEVIENIFQSYPMHWIMIGILTASFIYTLLILKLNIIDWSSLKKVTYKDRCLALGSTLILPIVAYTCWSHSFIPKLPNQYHCELAKNGSWSFVDAYNKMEIDFDQWYLTLPLQQAVSMTRNLIHHEKESAISPYKTSNGLDTTRMIKGQENENHYNVILICMESMSAEFMAYFKNTKAITPNLDALAQDSIFFSNLRATGTRTVRGMEALTLNLPPTPGQAIFYRPDGVNLKTTFEPFLERNYDCAFIYGGHGQFDYMNRFFSTSGCRIVDLNQWDKNDITMKTAWGACDEDLFNKTIKEADIAHAKGKPFHYFCMTTSNHRPFDFPDGRIDLKSHSGRSAAVKYADWSIGHLIKESSTKPWFKNTLFVICADHCASSAGKSDLDITKYHIPAMIYNPSIIKPQNIQSLCSQIDVMPTVFSILGWKYETVGFGKNLLNSSPTDFQGRAFISNYQKIALLKNNELVILKPNKEHVIYDCKMENGSLIEKKKSTSPILNEAISYYQTASWLFKNGMLKREPKHAN